MQYFCMISFLNVHIKPHIPSPTLPSHTHIHSPHTHIHSPPHMHSPHTHTYTPPPTHTHTLPLPPTHTHTYRGADIDATDEDQLTPLLVAVIHGSTDAVDALLENGADVHHVDESGRSAVFLAAEHNRINILKVSHKDFHVWNHYMGVGLLLCKM